MRKKKFSLDESYVQSLIKTQKMKKKMYVGSFIRQFL